MTRREDYFAPGDWNAICDGCGAKLKASRLRKDWQGWMKCHLCWEPRHPQDFVRARSGAEPAPVPFVRQQQAVTYVHVCTVNSQSSVAGYATANCWRAGYISPSFDPTIGAPAVPTCTADGENSLPDAAIADCWVANYINPLFNINA